MALRSKRHWREKLRDAVDAFMTAEVQPVGDSTYVAGTEWADTPTRVVRAFGDMVSGYSQDAGTLLDKRFSLPGSASMVHVENIAIRTTCEHHLMPIIGIGHFAYIPKHEVVGLSKIPAFIRVLATRLQMQERLGEQIVDTFQQAVQPQGCAMWIRAFHTCMSSRGIFEHEAKTKTLALRGAFRKNQKTREELLSAINQHASIFE